MPKLDSEYHNRFSDVPIASHTGVKQIDHLSFAMTIAGALPDQRDGVRPQRAGI